MGDMGLQADGGPGRTVSILQIFHAVLQRDRSKAGMMEEWAWAKEGSLLDFENFGQ